MEEECVTRTKRYLYRRELSGQLYQIPGADLGGVRGVRSNPLNWNH